MPASLPGSTLRTLFPLRALDTRALYAPAIATTHNALAEALRAVPQLPTSSMVLRIAADVTRILQQQQGWQSQVSRMIAEIHRQTTPTMVALQATLEQINRTHGRRARQVCDLVAPHGWSVDALMHVTGDEILDTLYHELETQGPGGYAQLLAQLAIAGAEDLKAVVREATQRLLPPEVADDFITPFEDAVDALVTNKGVSLVAATMLSRAEGLFTRALKARGHFGNRKSMLFTNQEQARTDREEIVALLDEALLDQPIRSRRVLVIASARERFEHARDLLAERYQNLQVNPDEAPLSRHHVLHDGYGSGAFPEALRTTLFYANVALFLDQRLAPFPDRDPSGT